ncbi:bifunctional glycosyltransferase family 2/GtrA family protein [Rhodococcoides corynebacterioides]|uniref:dolichyl-phosphate beta-glucosyltransferase n=1 Tax=Rhodococcoides corynebacterioides TaxID=53972 RepID=A0ABS7P0A9_9NOCA|nr:bifunctional glycosyltransferase family 2/GtrA family protein [Rhodococcus corynebacterioides]MBY6365815.1 bifunctional glycosyltransferase family 2/GtrA family protein [Rhodococcus corynebacterioides]MBY6408236.1 bifunctional glycosyltransferase family 2/GtrA family protein [Rhodococcus corynebacterioides]
MTTEQLATGRLVTRPDGPPSTAVTVDIVVPVYNEAAVLADSIRRLHRHLAAHVPYRTRIVVADNASTDDTPGVAAALAAELDRVEVVRLDLRGRGRALDAVWRTSSATIVAYMDVDLSTDLRALLPLLAPLASGHSDVAIGSRLAPQSRVVRGPKREIVSRSYNLILRTSLRVRFSDAQCGFKALRTDVARELLPLVQDTGWFFDTELLVLAERAGLRIHEVPVDWVDDPHSTVDIAATAVADLKGCWRVGRALATGALPLGDLRRSVGREPLVQGVPIGMVGQLVRFAGIGGLSTIAYGVLYLLLHPVLGAQTSNLLALAITAVLNTAANRAVTFGVRGAAGAVGHHLHGLAIFALGWAVTAGSLLLLHRWSPDASKHLELTVLVLANAVATVIRFVALRRVFRSPAVRPSGKDLAR